MNQIFNYKGSTITFQKGDGSVMVNATEMAKPFGKRPIDWLRLPSTETFLGELSNVRESHNWIITERGQHTGGTWMHEDVALEYARWLSPAFAIWCNDHIKQLLKEGTTSIGSLNEDQIVLEALQIQQRKIIHLTKENEVLRPKAALMEKVLNMDENVDIGQVAKILELPYGRNTLFQKLKIMGILFKGRNEPKQEYVRAGYFRLKEHIVTREHHPDLLVLKVLVTQKGLDWLARKLDVIQNNKQLAMIYE